MAIVDGGSTMAGSSSTSMGGAVIFHFDESVSGTSDMSGTGGTIYLGSGTFLGSSSFVGGWTVDGSSSMGGSSSMSGDGFVVHRIDGGAVMLGTSSMQQATLLPIWGTSFASMNPLVITPLRSITMGPKTFRWMQLFQRGDLSIFFCDGDGTVAPIQVVYSLYFVRLDGTRRPVGPSNRTPVSGDFGEYYAVGSAGAGGQPGNWVIEWKYQRSIFHPVEVVEMSFMVLDAVLAQDPYDITDRKVKFGWN